MVWRGGVENASARPISSAHPRAGGEPRELRPAHALRAAPPPL